MTDFRAEARALYTASGLDVQQRLERASMTSADNNSNDDNGMCSVVDSDSEVNLSGEEPPSFDAFDDVRNREDDWRVSGGGARMGPVSSRSRPRRETTNRFRQKAAENSRTRTIAEANSYRATQSQGNDSTYRDVFYMLGSSLQKENLDHTSQQTLERHLSEISEGRRCQSDTPITDFRVKLFGRAYELRHLSLTESRRLFYTLAEGNLYVWGLNHHDAPLRRLKAAGLKAS